MSPKPAIVFVTGSFTNSEFYDNIKEPLLTKGYEIVIPQLLSAGKKPGVAPSMYDDAKMIATEVTKFADQGKDVLLVAHSYGGTPASEAIKGLSKTDREKQGKKGGVVRIAYMTCLVPDVGKAAPTANDPNVNGELMAIDEDMWMHQSNLPATAQMVFNHLSPADGLAFAKKMPQHSAVSFGSELTYAGYKDVPSSWLLCEDDLCIRPEYQQKSIDRIEAATGRKVDVTRGDWDHCPSVEKPEDVVEWIVGAAERGGAW